MSDEARERRPSQTSQSSHTAQEFIASQLQLEADAREALPYQFDTCTKPLGPLRQSLFSCLTCNPPPEDINHPHIPAGICYSCSISCHGEHELVELFSRRNFVCDCGTTRMPSESPCTLRANQVTGLKDGVHSEEPAATNTYNQNFRNRFCGCSDLYDPSKEKGTMFQCLGLGTTADGGCGEDWWHAECIVGIGRDWLAQREKNENHGKDTKTTSSTSLPTIAEEQLHTNGVNGHSHQNEDAAETHREEDIDDDEDPPLPPGFPAEDDFEHFICYKCVNAFPWIKRYAGSPGFLPAVPHQNTPANDPNTSGPDPVSVPKPQTNGSDGSGSRKRKADDDNGEADAANEPTLKRAKPEDVNTNTTSTTETTGTSTCKHSTLPPAPTGDISLFLQEDFRTHLCRCAACFPTLRAHPQLLDEEPTYSPPVSEGSSVDGDGSLGSRSLLDRGEAALSNMDRVRAIEGVMAYNHLRDKVKTFLKPFAESGTPVGAEDVKKYFEKLRGDEQGIRQAAADGDAAAAPGDDDDNAGGDGAGGADGRRQQSGY